jgi:mortality factor 4-like protein 1
MPPKQSQAQQAQPPFSKDERVLCFHMEMLYEAKILDIMTNESGDGWNYKIHYKGWKSSWDDWVPQDRVRKFTEENKDLAQQLANQFKTLQAGKAAKQQSGKKGTAGRGGAGGSDMSSARGSEERTAGGGQMTGSGRIPRKGRDLELEQVSGIYRSFVFAAAVESLAVAYACSVARLVSGLRQRCRWRWGSRREFEPPEKLARGPCPCVLGADCGSCSEVDALSSRRLVRGRAECSQSKG